MKILNCVAHTGSSEDILTFRLCSTGQRKIISVNILSFKVLWAFTSCFAVFT